MRSHVSRVFSLRHPTHRLVFVAATIVGVLAGIEWLAASSPPSVLLAPLYVGVVWSLTREVDPDHQWTALVGGAFAGVWALYLGETVSLLAVVALMAAARVMTESTGRRPLLTDVLVLGGLGVAASYTPEGWAAGVGMTAGLLLDDRLAWRKLGPQRAIAAATLAGATAVAWLSDVGIPVDVRGSISVVAAVLSVAVILRRPEEPSSVVDARHQEPLQRGRLHTSRAVTAIVVYGMTVMVGAVDAEKVTPLLVVIALIILSNEIERLRRRG